MGDLTKANPQLVDTLGQFREHVISEKVVKIHGSGVAFQAVSMSTAHAIQDATDYVRNVTTIATTAIGMALSKLVETKDPAYGKIIETAQQTINTAATNMKTIGAAATEIAKGYPVGE